MSSGASFAYPSVVSMLECPIHCFTRMMSAPLWTSLEAQVCRNVYTTISLRPLRWAAATMASLKAVYEIPSKGRWCPSSRDHSRASRARGVSGKVRGVLVLVFQRVIKVRPSLLLDTSAHSNGLATTACVVETSEGLTPVSIMNSASIR